MNRVTKSESQQFVKKTESECVVDSLVDGLKVLHIMRHMVEKGNILVTPYNKNKIKYVLVVYHSEPFPTNLPIQNPTKSTDTDNLATEPAT